MHLNVRTILKQIAGIWRKVGQRISVFAHLATPRPESTHARVIRHPQEFFLG